MKTDSDYDKFITEAFREEPDFSLSSGFADRLSEKMRKEYAFRESMKEYVVYVVLLLGIALLTGGFLLFINKGNISPLHNFVTRYLAEIISIVFIANFILFADKVLLRLLFTFRRS